MTRTLRMLARSALVVACMALAHAAQADIEVTGPDGRRILLYDNGTWRYADGEKGPSADKSKDQGEAVLSLERKIERGRNCRFVVRLVNNLPYEIRSLVPYYAAYRADGVIYDTVSAGSSFAAMRPGDQLVRDVDITGISCQEIVRVQVVGGDRCDMGDLDKFSGVKGECLARVRVVASDLLRFDK